MKKHDPRSEETSETDAANERFLDAVLAADTLTSAKIVLEQLPGFNPDTFLKALKRRRDKIRSVDREGTRRLEILEKALSKAYPKDINVIELPPFKAYQDLSAGLVTVEEVAELWRVHLADSTWKAEWIKHIDLYIHSRTDGAQQLPEYIPWVCAQVAAARMVGQLHLLAQVLITCGGVHIRMVEQVAKGLDYEIDALEVVKDEPPDMILHLIHVVAVNFNTFFPVLPQYDDTGKILPVGKRFVEIMKSLAETVEDPDVATACFVAMATAVYDIGKEDANEVEELAIVTRSVKWSGLRVKKETIEACIALALYLPLDLARETTRMAIEMAATCKDRDLLCDITLRTSLLLGQKCSKTPGEAKGEKERTVLAENAETLERWLSEYGDEATHHFLGLALYAWANATIAIQVPFGKNINEQIPCRLEAAMKHFLADGDISRAEAAIELLGETLGCCGCSDLARRYFISTDESIDPQETAVRAMGVYHYCLHRWMSRTTDPQVLGRELGPMLDYVCRSTKDDIVRIRCAQLLIQFITRSYCLDATTRSDLTWSLITLLTDYFSEEPAVDAEHLAEYYCVLAEVWQYVASQTDARPDDVTAMARTAQQYLEKAAEACEAAGKLFMAASWRIQLAKEIMLDDPDHARQLLDQAEKIVVSPEGDAFFWSAPYFDARALLFELTGENDRALETYRRAIELTMQNPSLEVRWNAKLFLANRSFLLMRLERWREAYEDIRQAIELEEQYIDRLPPLQPSENITSLESTTAALSGFTQPVYSDMALVCLRLGRLDESFEFSERARASNLRREIRARNWQNVNEMEYLVNVQQLQETLQGESETAFIEYLVRDECTLAYIVTGGEFQVFELPGRRTPEMGRLCSMQVHVNSKEVVLHELTETLLANMSDTSTLKHWTQGVETLGERMFDTLLAPLYEKFQAHNVKHVIIAGNQGLEALPWNVVNWFEKGKRTWLLDHCAIHKVPTATIWAWIRSARSSSNKGVVIQGINPNLPFLSLEVDQVNTSLSRCGLAVTFETTDEAEAVLNAVVGSSHIHVACHGEFESGDVLDSRLILNPQCDRSLSLRRIVESRFHPGSLIVLAACETGMLRIDPGGEHLGLPTALLLAGAGSVIGAGWPAHDFATALLITRFYKVLPAMLEQPADALRRAALWLRDLSGAGIVEYLNKFLEQYREQLGLRSRLLKQRARWSREAQQEVRPFASPFYWAAFELFG